MLTSVVNSGHQTILHAAFSNAYFFLWLEHRKGTTNMKGDRGFANTAFVIDELDDLCHTFILSFRCC